MSFIIPITLIILVTSLLLPKIFKISLYYHIPGPFISRLTSIPLTLNEFLGKRTRQIHSLHEKYGQCVLISPYEIHFNTPTAINQIYGTSSGSKFARAPFYRLFDVYGRPNLFTFASTASHAARRRLLGRTYANSVIVQPNATRASKIIEAKTIGFLEWIARDISTDKPSEIFTSLHYFALDVITAFLYGDNIDLGGTCALALDADGDDSRKLLNDIVDPARRKISWCYTHFPKTTSWLYSRKGWMKLLLPMERPTTYTGIRDHALKAYWTNRKVFQQKLKQPEKEKPNDDSSKDQPLVVHLFSYHHEFFKTPLKSSTLDDLDIASECADHLLAGIDTTSDTLMFILWALSLPENVSHQIELVRELRANFPSNDSKDLIPSPASSAQLPFLSAVIKESLRLYSPLPSTEPRLALEDTIVDGFAVPKGTIVGVQQYSMHRNETIFEDAETFNPMRWIENHSSVDSKDVTKQTDEVRLKEMNRWWWAYSSGPRGCIGMHLAQAEMNTLVAAVYTRYTTSISNDFINKTPAISSRFELFFDEKFTEHEEHTCWIKFKPQV